MTASQDFKDELRQEKLDSNSIAKALKIALTEAIELKITTWVVPADNPNATGNPDPGYRMRTRINIVDGDIDNEIGSLFVGNGPYTELRDFHLKQVADGRDILQQNLESLENLFSTLVGTMQKLAASKRPTTMTVTTSVPSLPPSNTL